MQLPHTAHLEGSSTARLTVTPHIGTGPNKDSDKGSNCGEGDMADNFWRCFSHALEHHSAAKADERNSSKCQNDESSI